MAVKNNLLRRLTVTFEAVWRLTVNPIENFYFGGRILVQFAMQHCNEGTWSPKYSHHTVRQNTDPIHWSLLRNFKVEKIRDLQVLRRDRLRVRVLSTKYCVRAWISVILAGKRDSRRHSTTSFGENVVVAETSFIILRLEEGVTSFHKDNSSNFSGESKVKYSFPGNLFFENTRKTFQSNLELESFWSSNLKVSTIAGDGNFKQFVTFSWLVKK